MHQNIKGKSAILWQYIWIALFLNILLELYDTKYQNAIIGPQLWNAFV